MTVPIDYPDFANPAQGLSVITPILNGDILAHGTFSPEFDVSLYQSLIISTGTSLLGAKILVSDPNANSEQCQITTPPDGLGIAAPPVIIPIASQFINLFNGGAEDLPIFMFASTRPVPNARSYIEQLDLDTFTGSAGALGTVELGYGGGAGPAFSQFNVPGPTAAGVFQIVTGTDLMVICDTTEFHNSPSGGSRNLYRSWVAPRGLWKMQFVVSTAAAVTVVARASYVA